MVLMAKTKPEPHHLSLNSREPLREKKKKPTQSIVENHEVCCETLLTHLKSLSLEGILHSSSPGRMSFLKGPLRAQRLSKSLTEAFSTCRAPSGSRAPVHFPWDRETALSGACDVQRGT